MYWRCQERIREAIDATELPDKMARIPNARKRTIRHMAAVQRLDVLVEAVQDELKMKGADEGRELLSGAGSTVVYCNANPIQV